MFERVDMCRYCAGWTSPAVYRLRHVFATHHRAARTGSGLPRLNGTCRTATIVPIEVGNRQHGGGC
jgi:hypothetical protein